MPKEIKKYTDQLNFLTETGTLNKLVAMSYFSGTRGKYGVVARNLVNAGIANFENTLDDKNKRIYEEILKNLSISAFLVDSGPDDV